MVFRIFFRGFFILFPFRNGLCAVFERISLMLYSSADYDSRTKSMASKMSRREGEQSNRMSPGLANRVN